MEFGELLRHRRMVRHYVPEPVPREVPERIVSTVRRAPSAGFSQGPRLLVVDQPRDAAAAAARRARPLEHVDLVDRLAQAQIGATYNQYADSTLRRARLREHLTAHADAPFVLVGEAAGYRGARVSGVPFTSER